MKATELIDALQEAVARDGDLMVRMYDPDSDDMESVTHVETYGTGRHTADYIALDTA